MIPPKNPSRNKEILIPTKNSKKHSEILIHMKNFQKTFRNSGPHEEVQKNTKKF